MGSSFRAGDVIAGRYLVVDLLAESGAGRFWRAHDSVLGRDVALHLIPGGDPRAPLLTEAARRSAAVSDPRVLRVLDADRTEDFCYVVNEWGSGVSLDHLLIADGAMTPRRAAWLVSEVADSISHAHAADVTHGRLVPEHVLIDTNGAVRLIGLAVDAALAGLPAGRRSTDVTDLVGLLYACLTGRWAGVTPSQVPAAPVEGGAVLRPRRVRAGIPRVLDDLCDSVLNHAFAPPAPGRVGPPAAGSAAAVAEVLAGFVGDATDVVAAEARLAGTRPVPQPPRVPRRLDPQPSVDGAAIAAAEAATSPDLRSETAPVGEVTAVLPTAPPADPPADPADPPADPTTESNTGPTTEPESSAAPAPDAEATQAGMPVFLDDTGDVAWIAARAVPPTPPPPFEEVEAKPLFAPAPEAGDPARRPRPGSLAEQQAQADYWPWESSLPSSTGTGTGSVPPVTEEDAEEEPVPGRFPLRVAALIAASMLLLLALVMGYNLGRGRTPLGQEIDETTPTPTPSETAGLKDLTDLTTADFDPQGNGEENPDTVARVVDGDPATGWRTLRYNDQLGPPPGLKTGVGLILDLGDSVAVREVQLAFTGKPTTAALYLTETSPRGVAGLTPVATGTARGTRLRVELPDGAAGRYLTVWLTALPPVPGGYRAEITEITVRA